MGDIVRHGLTRKRELHDLSRGWEENYFILYAIESTPPLQKEDVAVQTQFIHKEQHFIGS